MSETITPSSIEKRVAYERYQKDIQALSKAADMLFDMPVSAPIQQSVFEELTHTEEAIAAGDDSEQTKELRDTLERAHLALGETKGNPLVAIDYLKAQEENNRQIARLVRPAEHDSHETPDA